MNTKQEIISDLQADREKLLAAQERFSRVLLREGYVVRCEGLTMTFDIDPKTLTVLGGSTMPLLQAPRYTKENALILANAMRNGNGTPGEAVHIRDAIAANLAECERLLKALGN